MTRNPAPSWWLAVLGLCVLVACGGESDGDDAAPSFGDLDSTFHLLSFSRLQGYAEGIPCNPANPSPMAAAATLRNDLMAQGDGALLACVGDALQHSAFVLQSRTAKESARARSEVVLDSMAAAGVDVYVPSHGDFYGGVEALLDGAADRGIDVVLSNVRYEGRELTPYKIVEHDGLKIAILGLIAPQSAASSKDEKLKILKPAKRVKTLCDEIAEQGLAHLIVAYSNLAGKANQTLCDAIDQLHFIVGSSDTGFKADRAVLRHGTTMLPLKTAGRELAHTTLHVTDGDFAFVDLSQLWILPDENALYREAIEEYERLHGSDDPEVLAPIVMPDDPQRFIDKYELLGENEAWVEEMRGYTGSFIAHRRAELPEPHDAVLAALARQGPAIEAALAGISRELEVLAEDTEVSRPEDCVSCHRDQTEFWEGTAHATSHVSLREAGRDQDTHCQMCHVAAYGDRGGFEDVRLDAPFGGVTCFICHIANRSHATVPRLTVDPLYITASVERMSCEGCHDMRRSPGFDKAVELPKVACPPMRPDEPALIEAYNRALNSFANRRADGRAMPRERYLEGRALVGLGRAEEGITQILEFAAENTSRPELAIEIAGFLDERMLSNAAIRVLSEFLQHMPTEPDVNQGLLQLLVHAKDPAARQPQEVLKRVPLLFPEDAETDSSSMPFRLLYVDALFALDRSTDGARILKTLDKALPNHPMVQERYERYGIER